ncbi:hypothetical protein [Turneriella parva]|uniref:Uncharacterized protein n=1 Tax=Turneriella parva (strain ATCC BAA-1111 / DSM 21527 / NCTC 11395 / H) TaxID=869212 RepID=I4BBD4_TURPD|nr:hypothetical protein [Turneriella parva]AFM14591.1 hypothetical protein Turpa_3957 [Turneriella parva DSM 21527]
MRIFAVTILLACTPLVALGEGELQFSLGGRAYATQHAAALVTTRNGKSRIVVAVKDINQRFLLMLSADVAAGNEKQPLYLSSADTDLAVTLRSSQGVFSLLPQQQLAKDANITYVEQVNIETDEFEDELESPAEIQDRLRGKFHARRKRKKMRSEYRRVKPAWTRMSRQNRLETGAGVIQNGAFRDTHFTLQLTPNVVNGKVVSYQGSFSGSGRFAAQSGSGEIKMLSGGRFHVRVEHAP